MAQSGSTMQLTRAADYAVRVMIHLATLPAYERALLPALAQATGAPRSSHGFERQQHPPLRQRQRPRNVGQRAEAP